MKNPATFATLLSIAAILWAAACGLQDLLKLKVSNILTLGMFLVAALTLLSGHALLGASVRAALFGLLAGVVLTVPGYMLGKLGAADVKMLAAIGLAAGLWGLLQSFVVGSFVALGLMVLIRILSSIPQVQSLLSWRLFANLTPRPGKSFPFAFCLALGFMSFYAVPFWQYPL